MEDKIVIENSKKWIADFVIQHNICPFAKHVFDKNAIGYIVEKETEFDNLVISFFNRLAKINYDTAFFIYESQYPDFLDFLDFYYACEAILEDSDFDELYQIVAFHPDYIFGGEDESDPSNLTNRSPYPMIHILLRDQVERAIESHDDVNSIPSKNIEYLRKLFK